jgi:NADH dehydrogenase [ubiquinone] 1 alpha subcomplex assembly factor 7
LVAKSLAERIRREGPMPLPEYMGAVAGAYYAQPSVIGAAGDFITAPEISQIFGELIGLWSAVIWQNMGAPPKVHVVECGPGRGTLMRDFLRAAERVPAFVAAAEVHLVEQSPTLRAHQHALLGNRAAWHDSIDTVPAGPMILVGNEFLDALPIRQFQRTPTGWMERYVTVDDGGRFSFVLKPGEIATAPPANPGVIFETSPAVTGFTSRISERLVRHGGAALLFDYGHRETAAGETLQALKQHKFCGLFDAPGQADLTAHVDFAAVADTARAAGAAVYGAIEQGVWLNRLGIKLRGLQLAKGKNPEVVKEIESGIRRLTEPDAMGVLFKVIAIADPKLPRPEGFLPGEGP